MNYKIKIISQKNGEKINSFDFCLQAIGYCNYSISVIPNSPQHLNIIKKAKEIAIKLDNFCEFPEEHACLSINNQIQINIINKTQHRISWEEMFSDDFSSNGKKFLRFWNINSDLKGLPIHKKQVFLILFYLSLYFYLDSNEKYLKLRANLTYLSILWQLYFLIADWMKKDTLDSYNLGPVFQELFKKLSNYLDDTNNISTIWYLAAIAGIRKPDLQTRENMRIALFILPKDKESFTNEEKPIDVGRCFSENRINWREIEVNPFFLAKENHKSAVRQFVSVWALPHYHFEVALQLSNRLVHKTSISKLQKREYLLYLFSLLWFSFVILVGTILVYKKDFPTEMISIFEFMIGCGGWLFVYLKNFDMKLTGSFLFPRLIGGIFVGYVALAVEDLSGIVTSLVTNRYSLILLWVIIILITFFYLYFEIKPSINRKKEIINRILSMILIMILLSANIGLIITAITTASYHKNNLCDPYGCFYGVIGNVNLNEFLIYVPITIFVGLVTQFIFEEKPITYPVWFSDRV